jgi:hypothetical protein
MIFFFEEAEDNGRGSMIDDTLYFFFRKKVDLDGDFFLTPGMDWMNHVYFFPDGT